MTPPRPLVLLSLLSLLLSITFPAIASSTQNDPCDASHCPATYVPVCATNGGSYANRCHFDAAHCRNASVVFAHDGVCVRNARRKPMVMLVGDSITEFGADPVSHGWQTLLAAQYIRQLDVLNRGCGGYTTKWFLEFGLPELIEDIRRLEPVLVTLWLGTNDAVLQGPQQVPLPQYRLYLKLLVEEMKKAGGSKTKVLLIAPAPVTEPAYSASLKEHCDVVVATAKDLNVDVLDLYSYFMTKFPDPAQQNALLRDGIHFNLKGNEEAFAAINAKIVEILPSSVLTQTQMPPYGELVDLPPAWLESRGGVRDIPLAWLDNFGFRVDPSNTDD